jgi:hypothetical protein
LEAEWSLETAASHTGRIVPAIVLAVLTIAAGVGYVAATSILGHGTLTVNVTSAGAGYTINVAFYSDQAATQPITSVQIPENSHQIVYAKLTNSSSNDYMNLYVTGGGNKLWMNVYKTDGTPLYVDGNVVGNFNLAHSASIVLKVDVGVLGATAGENLTLGLDVCRD